MKSLKENIIDNIAPTKQKNKTANLFDVIKTDSERDKEIEHQNIKKNENLNNKIEEDSRINKKTKEVFKVNGKSDKNIIQSVKSSTALKKSNNKDFRINLRVKSRVGEGLKQICKKENTTISQIVEALIEDFVNKNL